MKQSSEYSQSQMQCCKAMIYKEKIPVAVLASRSYTAVTIMH